MTERRCPRCGGLVGPDAEWCGQCFARLDGGASRPAARPAPADQPTASAPAPTEPAVAAPTATPEPAAVREEAAPPAPSGPTPAGRGSGSGAFRVSDDGLRWVCPSCELENPLEEGTCARCGTEFRTLFAEDDAIPAATRARAPSRSLLFPGLGYRALGRGTEGVARGITFLWMAGMALAVVFVRRGTGLGPFLPLVLVLALAAIAVYVLTYLDAKRIAGRERPVLSARTLLYVSGGTMLLTIATVVIVAMRARG